MQRAQLEWSLGREDELAIVHKECELGIVHKETICRLKAGKDGKLEVLAWGSL